MGNPADPMDPETVTIDFTCTLKLTLLDIDMLGAMQAATGLPTIDALIEQALPYYAKFLQVGPVPAEFMMYRRRLNALGRPWTGK